MATINMLEETANYLLNHCFVLGSVEDQRAKYLYVQDHLDEVRAVFEAAHGPVEECRLMTSYRSTPEITELFAR